MKGRTHGSREEPNGLDRAMNPTGGARGSALRIEASPGVGLLAFLVHSTPSWEPPGADPHAGWCGSWGGEPPGYPIRKLHFRCSG